MAVRGRPGAGIESGRPDLQKRIRKTYLNLQELDSALRFRVGGRHGGM
jgi:hypothetical protein